MGEGMGRKSEREGVIFVGVGKWLGEWVKGVSEGVG